MFRVLAGCPVSAELAIATCLGASAVLGRANITRSSIVASGHGPERRNGAIEVELIAPEIQDGRPTLAARLQ